MKMIKPVVNLSKVAENYDTFILGFNGVLSNGNEILPKPSNKYQRMVHMCDFLASKKFIEVEFDSLNNIVN